MVWMKRAIRRLFALSLLAMVVVAVPAVAHAATLPGATPATITSENFDELASQATLTSGMTLGPGPQLVGTTAYAWWGANPKLRRGLSGDGLWCAGSMTTLTAPAVAWPHDYPEVIVPGSDTQPSSRSASAGDADLAMAQMSNYYSAYASFWYSMPTLGVYEAAPYAGFTVDTGVQPMFGISPQVAFIQTQTSENAWRQVNIDVTNPANGLNNMSRQANSKFRLEWVDYDEDGQTPRTGEGPTVDDLAITGWKYGPVRSLAATIASGNVHLTWQRPWRSTAATSTEERTIAYRVWRSISGAGNWTELTGARLADSATSYDDSSIGSNGTYDYVVQAWDTGSGTGYGQVATATITVAIATPSTTSNVNSQWHTAPFNVILTATDQGPGVAWTRYKLGSNPSVTSFVNPTSFSVSTEGTTSLSYASADMNGHVEPTQTATVKVDATPPNTTASVATTYSGGGNTVALHATDNLSGVAATHFSIDGGSQQTGAAVPVPATPGAHTLDYSSVDNAGNVEGTHHASFNVVIPNASVLRLGGSTRNDVAATAAVAAYPGWAGITDVVVASGDTAAMADPLAAAGLAGVYDAPILLVSKTGVPTVTRSRIAAIASANPGVKIHIVGGTGSVPGTVASALAAIPGVNKSIDRVSGADRYAVTTAIAGRMATVLAGKGQTVPGILIVCSENPSAFYDALAASPIAARQHMPMVGVRASALPLPKSVSSLLGSATFKSVPRYVVSSTTYVSGSVYTAVGGQERLTTSANVYQAAYDIAVHAVDTHGWLQADNTGLAAKLPDALTGGAFTGKKGGPLLFTDSTSKMQTAPSNFIANHHTQIHTGWVLGGTASLTEAVRNAYLTAIQ